MPTYCKLVSWLNTFVTPLGLLSHYIIIRYIRSSSTNTAIYKLRIWKRMEKNGKQTPQMSAIFLPVFQLLNHRPLGAILNVYITRQGTRSVSMTSKRNGQSLLLRHFVHIGDERSAS